MSQAQSFEQSMSRLEEVVAALERGDLDLDLALRRYEEGVALVAGCRQALEQAELKVRRLVQEGGSTRLEEASAAGLFGGVK